jgi:hypothetical protein
MTDNADSVDRRCAHAMHNQRSIARGAIVILAALSVSASAQEQRSLGRPIAEFPEPFTYISTIRELRDGRVLLVDERERTLNLIDFASGVVKQVGREGAGPGEYATPGRLVALPGDTSLLHDPRNGRYLLIKPDGTPGETYRLGNAALVSLGARGSIPRTSDANGALYFEGSPFTRGGATIKALDSVPLVRYHRQSARLDTVTWLHVAAQNVQVRPGADAGGVSISVGVQAYQSRDDWAALPDGSVAVARVRDYHIDWYSPSGARSSGPAMRITPVRVTEKEKAAWRAERRARATTRTAGSIPVNIQEPDWPSVLPPFVYFQTFAHAPGEMWVLRSHRAEDPPMYDVFAAPGALRMRITLPARTRLLGFGSGALYLVRTDEDDLQFIQKYRWP